jgi:hypothetical protein
MAASPKRPRSHGSEGVRRVGGEVHDRPLRRLILRCRLCDPDGLLLEPTSGHALYAAVDHALDQHRSWLVADPEHVLACLQVAA